MVERQALRKACVDPPPSGTGWNGTDPTVTFTCVDAESTVVSCSGPVTVTSEGAEQLVVGTAADDHGNTASFEVLVSLDKSAPVVAIDAPSAGELFTVPEVLVTGMASDSVSGIETVLCNGIEASANIEGFACPVPLAAPNEVLQVEAVDFGGNIASTAVNVAFDPPPVLDITSPGAFAFLPGPTVMVTGSVSSDASAVEVDGISAVLDGTGGWSAEVSLHDGINRITAIDAAGSVVTTGVEVTVDLTPPAVTVLQPADGSVVHTASVAVSGVINDVVVGTVIADMAEVTVNGMLAEVANRGFLADSVSLVPGPNTVTVVGIDRAGNSTTVTSTVSFEPAVGAEIEIVGGNLQTGLIGTELPQALEVLLTDAAGQPVVAETAVFKVTVGSGELRSGMGAAPSRALAATTDASGVAQVLFTLGDRAGAGNQQVTATAAGYQGNAIFTACAEAALPAAIYADSGDQQTGSLGQDLPRALVAGVTDAEHNRLGGIPVTFSVLGNPVFPATGTGHFSGSQSLTVSSDTEGRVQAMLTLGDREGMPVRIAADFPGNPGAPVRFTAVGVVPGDPAATSNRGVVLDPSDRPIPGVTLEIDGSSHFTQSDAEGQFFLPSVPVGHLHLIADGSTALLPGTWPRLEFELLTIPGKENSLGMPIYLLPLETGGSLPVDASNGGTLTLPGTPGFALEIAPGSVTFPDGSGSGVVAVTPVHSDKIPMTPNFGLQPSFVVTIQPPGAHFDPPAPMTVPNVDGLAPGAVTEMFSFDHDLGQFVAIGFGTVSNDGMVIRSNPGIGIVKGGWHEVGDPAPTGEVEEEDGVDVVIEVAERGDLPFSDDLGQLVVSGLLENAGNGVFELIYAEEPCNIATVTDLIPFCRVTVEGGEGAEIDLCPGEQTIEDGWFEIEVGALTTAIPGVGRTVAARFTDEHGRTTVSCATVALQVL